MGIKPAASSDTDIVGNMSRVVVYTIGILIAGAVIGLPLVIFWHQIPLNIRMWLDIRILVVVVFLVGVLVAKIYEWFSK